MPAVLTKESPLFLPAQSRAEELVRDAKLKCPTPPTTSPTCVSMDTDLQPLT